MTQTVQDQQQDERHHSVIEEFLKKYRDARKAAETAHEITDTDGWQVIYADHVATERKARLEQQRTLALAVESLEIEPWTEHQPKTVKDALKAIGEQIEYEAAWRRSTVSQVVAPVNRCRELIESLTRQCASLAATQPLVDNALPEQARQVIAGLDVPEFDEQTGIISWQRGERGE